MYKNIYFDNRNYIFINLKKKKLKVNSFRISWKKAQASYKYIEINGLKNNNVSILKEFGKKKVNVFFVSNLNMIETKWGLLKIFDVNYQNYNRIKKKKEIFQKMNLDFNDSYQVFIKDNWYWLNKKNLKLKRLLIYNNYSKYYIFYNLRKEKKIKKIKDNIKLWNIKINKTVTYENRYIKKKYKKIKKKKYKILKKKKYWKRKKGKKKKQVYIYNNYGYKMVKIKKKIKKKIHFETFEWDLIEKKIKKLKKNKKGFIRKSKKEKKRNKKQAESLKNILKFKSKKFLNSYFFNLYKIIIELNKISQQRTLPLIYKLFFLYKLINLDNLIKNEKKKLIKKKNNNIIKKNKIFYLYENKRKWKWKKKMQWKWKKKKNKIWEIKRKEKKKKKRKKYIFEKNKYIKYKINKKILQKELFEKSRKILEHMKYFKKKKRKVIKGLWATRNKHKKLNNEKNKKNMEKYNRIIRNYKKKNFKNLGKETAKDLSKIFKKTLKYKINYRLNYLKKNINTKNIYIKYIWKKRKSKNLNKIKLQKQLKLVKKKTYWKKKEILQKKKKEKIFNQIKKRLEKKKNNNNKIINDVKYNKYYKLFKLEDFIKYKNILKVILNNKDRLFNINSNKAIIRIFAKKKKKYKKLIKKDIARKKLYSIINSKVSIHINVNIENILNNLNEELDYYNLLKTEYNINYYENWKYKKKIWIEEKKMYEKFKKLYLYYYMNEEEKFRDIADNYLDTNLMDYKKSENFVINKKEFKSLNYKKNYKNFREKKEKEKNVDLLNDIIRKKKKIKKNKIWKINIKEKEKKKYKKKINIKWDLNEFQFDIKIPKLCKKHKFKIPLDEFSYKNKYF